MKHFPKLLVALLVACGSTSTTTDFPSADLGIANEQHLESGLIVGGQPTTEDLLRADAAGLTTVVSLRLPSEPGFAEEQAEVEELGMRFVSIPVDGASGLTEANARTLDAAISDPSTTLVHCGSGNRAGALLALRAFHVQGQTPEQALAIGRRAGLTRLTPAVADHLQAQQQNPHHHATEGHHHDFSNVEHFAQRFDAPERDAWQKPDEVIAAMEISSGMAVADLGAGTGYFLSRLSAAVGTEGRVLALDTEAAMVAHMSARIEEESLTNASAQVVATDNPGIENVDRVLIVNTWHHISDRTSYARKLREGLADGGRVIIVDFEESSDFGPPAAMRLTPNAVLEELRAAGFTAEQVEESLPNQYILVAR